MKYVWSFIDRQNWQADTKYRAMLWILGILYALAGFAVWLIVRLRILSTWDWLVCFTGYPVVISWLAVFLYSCSHPFHNGRPGRRAE